MAEQRSDAFTLPGGLAGLASQFGVSLPASATSPMFYIGVLGSRTIGDRVLESQFADPRTGEPGGLAPLLDILEIASDTHADALELGRRALEGIRPGAP